MEDKQNLEKAKLTILSLNMPTVNDKLVVWVVGGLWVGCGWVVGGLWVGCGWVVVMERLVVVGFKCS